VVDHRADLYAVGVMLCEILLGDAACEPRRITPYGPVFAWTPRLAQFLPPDVAAILERALAEDPARRFPDAAQFRGKLVAALARRAPGYGADELARDLAALDEGFLSELPTIASEAIELQTDLGGETSPQLEHKPTGSHAVRRSPPPVPAVSLLMPAEPSVSSSALRLRPRLWSRATAVWAACAAGAAALAVTALLLTGASSAEHAPSSSSLARALPSVSREAALPSRATGTLAVEGPAGATVIIGSTIYPVGALELPAGEYQVTLKRRPRSRGVIRHITVGAGQVTPIRL
jgi:hypothetical protein